MLSTEITGTLRWLYRTDREAMRRLEGIWSYKGKNLTNRRPRDSTVTRGSLLFVMIVALSRGGSVWGDIQRENRVSATLLPK